MMKSNKIIVIGILSSIIATLIFLLSQKEIKNSRGQGITGIIKIPELIVTKSIRPETTKDDELSKVISNLKSIVKDEKKKEKKEDLTEDEVQNILSNLKALKPVETKKRSVKRKKKKRVKKRRVVKKRKKIIGKKVKRKRKKIVKKKTVKKRKKYNRYNIYGKDGIMSAEEYRKKLSKESQIDEELRSLPMVETVDMDIEEKIKRGEVPKLTTPKPLVEKETIYIPPSEKDKIDDNIPWAELIDMNEKVDGIFINETIN